MRATLPLAQPGATRYIAQRAEAGKHWIPACAGTTSKRMVCCAAFRNRRSLTVVSGRQPPDLGAEAAQFFLDVLVAAVDVIDAIDDGFAIGHQPRQHQ